jgi:hypothetical protein
MTNQKFRAVLCCCRKEQRVLYPSAMLGFPTLKAT